jgi:hypothetical protein
LHDGEVVLAGFLILAPSLRFPVKGFNNAIISFDLDGFGFRAASGAARASLMRTGITAIDTSYTRIAALVDLLTTPELPDLVHSDAVPAKKDQILPLTLLRAYGELAISDPQYARAYLKIVDQLAQTNPDGHAVLSALGWREFGRNTPEGNE